MSVLVVWMDVAMSSSGELWRKGVGVESVVVVAETVVIVVADIVVGGRNGGGSSGVGWRRQ